MKFIASKTPKQNMRLDVSTMVEDNYRLSPKFSRYKNTLDFTNE